MLDLFFFLTFVDYIIGLFIYFISIVVKIAARL